MAMKYHIHAEFKGSDFSYHSEFETHAADIEAIKQAARVQLTKKLIEWHKDAEALKVFEIYYFDELTEKQVFKYENNTL